MRLSLAVVCFALGSLPSLTSYAEDKSAAKPTSSTRTDEDEDRKLKATSDAVTYALKTTGPENAIETGGAMIWVNAPIEKVRKVVQDFGHYKQLVPTFDQSRVLAKSKASSQVYLSVPILNGAMTIWAITNLAAPVKDGAGEKIVGTYEKGNLADFRATWRLRAVDAEHTVLKCELLVDPKLPVPTTLVTTQLKKSAEKAVRAVKEKVESAPPKALVATAEADKAREAAAEKKPAEPKKEP